ncbi:MAG: hypothetical protein ACP6KW_05350 [Candidatus Thorarchaeota archaeon]
MRKITTTFILIAFVSTLVLMGPTGQVLAALEPNETATVAAADLNRVDWHAEYYTNPGFEKWNTWYQPSDLGSTYTTEKYVGYKTAPWPVSEGSRSMLLQSRAIVPAQYPEARVTRSSWTYWNNPLNTTFSMDWYVDTMANPIDGDVFEIEFAFGAPGTREVHYYLGCESTTLTNNTWQTYFMIDGPVQSWNTLSRNLTADFEAAFGDLPTQFRLFNIYVSGHSPELTRALVDDIWLVNGTVIIGGSTQNGNFETTAAWYTSSPNDPAVVSQSTVRQEGDYSANLTVMSSGNLSQASVGRYPFIWVSEDNPDTLSLTWRIDELELSNFHTYSYMYVTANNGTDDFTVFYLFTYGESFSVSAGNNVIINATGFNITGQWHQFSRSIYQDIAEVYNVSRLQIESIWLSNVARTRGARTVMLFDGISLSAAGLCDMGYEDQGPVGSEIYAWQSTSSDFTVTDAAYSGQKAANASLLDSSLYLSQTYGYRPVNDGTDLWLDLYWRIESNSQDDGNMAYFEVAAWDEVAEDTRVLAYYMLNVSPISASNGFDAYIQLPQANTEGSWIHLQRNIYNDLSAAFGGSFDGKIVQITLVVETGTGGEVQMLFDDLYLYEDPEPIISGLSQEPANPVDGDTVNVTVNVYDPSLGNVLLFYRLDNGTWTNIEMSLNGSLYTASIPHQDAGTSVEYYVRAADTFDNFAESEHVSFTYSASTTTTPVAPDMLPLVAAAAAIAAIVLVVLVYMFYWKPKQTT